MQGKPKKHVLVCVQGRPQGHPRGSCRDRGSGAVYQAFLDEFQKRQLWESGYMVTDTGCMGPCHLGATVVVYPDGLMYLGVKPEDVPVIIDEHLMFDQPVKRLLAPPEIWGG
ncbi:MAG: (2Fe-2S) ferredoxin domain-containing protein [Zoogloeaceae bacterium]|nr:(2Fe-2S) ferredoxin domain-containing protein [Zoogloeaceae bacterium]